MVENEAQMQLRTKRLKGSFSSTKLTQFTVRNTPKEYKACSEFA